MRKIYSVLLKIIKIKILKTKIIHTLFFLLIYRFASYIPIPGINTSEFINFLQINNDYRLRGLINILSSFTGGAFNRASVLALGIMPYISSSILIQLMRLVLPVFQKLQNEGESGRRSINYITKWLTIIICVIQSISYILILKNKFIPYTSIPNAYYLQLDNPINNLLFWFSSIMVLTTGTLFTVWLGEKISDEGIGNGVSLIIMSGIISKLPYSIFSEIINRINSYKMFGIFILLIEFCIWLLLIMFSILIVQAVVRVPIQYTNRWKNQFYHSDLVVSHQYIPFKLITSGIMPVIFSQAIMLLPLTVFSHFNNVKILKILSFVKDVYGFWYNVFFVFFIILFTFFYTAIAIPVNQMSEDFKKNNIYIPNVKPGIDTVNYLDKILLKITFPGSILLSIISILPSLIVHLGIDRNFALFCGGTSLIIIISVFLETIQYVDSYLLNDYYDNIMKNKIF